jgi:hypothetical protein
MEESDMDAPDGRRPGMPADRLNHADPFIVNTTRSALTSPDVSSITDEQRQALRRVSDAGGNVHRNAIAPRMIAVLLSARLLAPYGPDRVELTSVAVQFLAGGDPDRAERPLGPPLGS